MKNLILLMILFLTCFMTSCVKEIPVIQEHFNDELVVNGLFKAYEPINLSITRQTPIYLSGNNPVDSSLTVILTQNDYIIDTMLYANNRYFSTYKAIPGNQYSITIESFEKGDLQAETIVPGNISDLKCEFTAGRKFDEYGEVVTESYISFKDDETKKDYYLLYIGDYNETQSFDIMNYWYYWQLNDPVLVNEGILEYNPSYFVFSDELFQGQHYSLNLCFKNGFRWNGAVYTPHEAYCVVQKISFEYYQFMKSFLRHQYNQQHIDYSRLDPLELLLKGQPSVMYTNIVNGKGVFASYSESLQEFEYITLK